MMAIVEYVKTGYTYPGVLKTKTALRPPKTPKLENKDPPPAIFFTYFLWAEEGRPFSYNNRKSLN